MQTLKFLLKDNTLPGGKTIELPTGPVNAGEFIYRALINEPLQAATLIFTKAIKLKSGYSFGGGYEALKDAFEYGPNAKVELHIEAAQADGTYKTLCNYELCPCTWTALQSWEGEFISVNLINNAPQNITENPNKLLNKKRYQ